MKTGNWNCVKFTSGELVSVFPRGGNEIRLRTDLNSASEHSSSSLLRFAILIRCHLTGRFARLESHRTITLTVCSWFMTALMVVAMRSSSANAQPFSELVVFGNSLEDVGNLNSRFTTVPPTPPYFDGRFSDGPVWVEKLAERLNLGPLAPSELGGTDYAWGGATTGSISSGFADDMDEQVRKYLASRTPGPNELFVLSGGFNDVSRGQTDASKPVQELSNQISQLAKAGAKNFLVATVPKYAGALVPRLNSLLRSELNELRIEHQGSSIVEFDLAGLFDSIMGDPASFGFRHARSPACKDCKSGNPSTTPTNIVDNPSEHFFWDNSHPSAAGHAVIGDAAYEALISVPIPPGDFNQDGVLDIADVNRLLMEIDSGMPDLAFDLNDDGIVDGIDVSIWAKDLKQTWIGDANLDGEFNSTDLVTVFQAGKYEHDLSALWHEGDWIADRRFDSGDLVEAFQDGGYEKGPISFARSVPEATPSILLAFAIIGLCQLRRIRMHS